MKPIGCRSSRQGRHTTRLTRGWTVLIHPLVIFLAAFALHWTVIGHPRHEDVF